MQSTVEYGEPLVARVLVISIIGLDRSADKTSKKYRVLSINLLHSNKQLLSYPTFSTG